MPRKSSKRPGLPQAAGAILLAFVALFTFSAFVGWNQGIYEMGWPVLSQLLGGSLVLIGALNLVRAGLSEAADLGSVVIHIGIILAGGVFLPGGWAALLGLALLGGVVLVVQHLDKTSDDE